MTPVEIIRLIAPEFNEVSDEDLEQIVELVRPMVSRKKYGDLYNQAIALLVCHRLKMAGMGAEDGLGSIADSLRVSSYSEGSRSISFGSIGVATGSADGELGLTVYGVQFINLRRYVMIPITNIGVANEYADDYIGPTYP